MIERLRDGQKRGYFFIIIFFIIIRNTRIHLIADLIDRKAASFNNPKRIIVITYTFAIKFLEAHAHILSIFFLLKNHRDVNIYLIKKDPF